MEPTAINPIAFTRRVNEQFLRGQLTAFPITEARPARRAEKAMGHGTLSGRRGAAAVWRVGGPARVGGAGRAYRRVLCEEAGAASAATSRHWTGGEGGEGRV